VASGSVEFLRTFQSQKRDIDFGQASFTISVSFSSIHPSKWGPCGFASDKRIVSKGHFALSPGYLLMVSNDGRVKCGIGSILPYAPGNNSIYMQTLHSIIDWSAWNNITVTCNRSTNLFKCYVNGVQQSLRPSLDQPESHLFAASGLNINFASAAAVLSASSNKQLFLGGAQELIEANVTDSSQFYNGMIGDVRMFDRELTSQEITDTLNSLFFLNTYSTTPTYSVTANGGLFFPWGYQKDNIYHVADLGKFKGPITITFSPSSVSQEFYPVLKIRYGFGDGNFTYVEKNIYGDNCSIVTNYEVVSTAVYGNPTNINISNTYWPNKDKITTYKPSISVIGSQGVFDVFDVLLSCLPDSIYSMSDFRLLNNTDVGTDASRKIAVNEAKYDFNYLNNLVIEENEESIIPTATPTPTPTITPTPTPTPISCNNNIENDGYIFSPACDLGV
jgi:hypothetical protein